jgi:GntR family transcriptional regulator
LADELDIAPGTVARAYAELERLGVVVTEGARGTRVAPRKPSTMSQVERPETLIGLLRPVAVAAFHLGASAQDLRAALEAAMKDIFGDDKRDAA